jgi:hypothetical protein
MLMLVLMLVKTRTHERGLPVIKYSFPIFAGICIPHSHDGACNVWRVKRNDIAAMWLLAKATYARDDDHKGKG